MVPTPLRRQKITEMNPDKARLWSEKHFRWLWEPGHEGHWENSRVCSAVNKTKGGYFEDSKIWNKDQKPLNERRNYIYIALYVAYINYFWRLINNCDRPRWAPVMINMWQVNNTDHVKLEVRCRKTRELLASQCTLPTATRCFKCSVVFFPLGKSRAQILPTVSQWERLKILYLLFSFQVERQSTLSFYGLPAHAATLLTCFLSQT